MIPPPSWWRVILDPTIGLGLALLVLGVILMAFGENEYLLFIAIGLLLGRLSRLNDR